LNSADGAGLGWWVTAGSGSSSSSKALTAGQVVLQVPASLALAVECPGDGPSDSAVAKLLPNNSKLLTQQPWFVQMALYLYKIDRVDSSSATTSSTSSSGRAGAANYRPWLDSLPRQFDTPIHWSASVMEELQYPYLTKQVDRQEQQWKSYYQQLTTATGSLLSAMSWDDFLWGCECARSRAFSGGYTGNAFDPAIYAFTLLLVTAYVGLGLGTAEQAANGAGVVVSVFILRDFVLPKLLKKKIYVICPMIDMANHVSVGAKGEVSFEYFGNAYSLTIASGDTVPVQEQVYISYGSRSNDQLLQYYGFVEKDNPNDVYIMPPLREWNIEALEKATGRTFAKGRLQKLDRAGLLGGSLASALQTDGDDEGSSTTFEKAANLDGGVVVTSVNGVDPAVLQALRALVSTDQEWKAAGEAVGNFSEELSGGAENERCARLAAEAAIEMELARKPTTLEEDEEILRRLETMKSLDASPEDKLALHFRIEKKKLLLATIDKLALK
jgi:hypothetical protein